MSLPFTSLWPRIEPILDAVVELPEPLRSARARDLCAEDHELGAAVASLLSADASAGDFLRLPLVFEIDPDETLGEREVAPTPDLDRVGPFRIVRELGRGGMGRVLLGERDDGQFEQRVAIKILHGDVAAGADGETLVRERRILARLEHPRIARMYDGGVTAQGEPYFVMEHVDGVPLDAYCERERPGLVRRLALFREVCRAVEFAHGRFVIHCDIKPRNILVTADGEVKLLDFGIASLLEEEAQGRGARVRSFTPAYAAPEQIRGDTLSAATDVYQLGIVLRGILAESEVPADLAAIVAKSLRSDPAARYATAEALRRDLEDFLEGRPVAAFSGSTGYRVRKWVRRYRLAVSATAAIVVVLAAGLIGVAVQARAASKARDRAAMAERRATAVNEFVLHELLQAPTPEVAMGRDLTVAEVLGNASRSVEHAFQGEPATEADVRMTLAQTYAALGRSADAAEHARAARLLLAGSPALAPGLLDRAERTIAALAIDDGRFDEARRSLEALHARQVAAFGPSAVETLRTSVELGRAWRGAGELDRAEGVLREAYALARRDRPEEWRLTSEIDRLLAEVLTQEFQGVEAESLLRETLATLGQHLGPEHPERIRALLLLAAALQTQLRYTEAAEVTGEALALSRRVYAPDHPAIADALGWHGVAQERLSRYDEALAALKESFEIRRRVGGDGHRRTVGALFQVAVLTANMGRVEEALPLMVEVVERRASLLGESHPETLRAEESLNETYFELNRDKEAREVAERMTRAYEAAITAPEVDAERLDQFATHLLTVRPENLRDPGRALDLATRAVAASGRKRYTLLRTLADAHAETGRPDLAIDVMQEALRLPDGLRSWSTVQAVVDLLRKTGRTPEIDGFLTRHRERQLAVPRLDERMVAKTERVLALHLQREGRPGDAEAMFAQADGRLRRILPEGNWEIGRLLSEWGGCRVDRGAYAEAEPLLLEGHSILEKDRGARKPASEARGRLVRLYEAWGRPADAARWKGAP